MKAGHEPRHFPAATSPPGSVAGPIASKLLISLLLLICCSGVLAQRPTATVPTDPRLVLERLPKGYARLAPAVGPATPDTAIARIERLLETGARSGDSRLAARADALLSRLPAETTDRRILAARAFAAQHRHDFAAALALLDRSILVDARDGHARLARAQVRLVQGSIDRARADCTVLLAIDLGNGMLCAASLAQRKGDYASAAILLERWLAQAGRSDPGRRYALLMRAETAARAQGADADTWFDRVLALDRDDVRTLASYARYLRGEGRNQDVERLLAGHPGHDGLQLQRALAAAASGSANAAALARTQADRYALAHAVGVPPELRDEAEFLLTLRQAPVAALELALENFKTQRDHEDAELLRRVAAAANQPAALAPMQAWAASQGLSLPALPAPGRR